jgi:hypothetical protein
LNPEHLNRVFVNTTNSYKYYWWLSIIELFSLKEKKEISFDEIIFKTISKLWYPVNYYKLSFGKTDQCSAYIKEIKERYLLDDDLSEHELYEFLIVNKDSVLLSKITSELTKYVPYRFIRPWFSQETRGLKDSRVNSKILEIQNETAPYSIDVGSNKIAINDSWVQWLRMNHTLTKAHVLFNLVGYLEKKNPNVPSLSKKLEKPETRNLTSASKYWRNFVLSNPGQVDVFGKKPLGTLEKFSLDHFMPWSFFTHDLLWNLHPVEKKVNSSKNNLIPDRSYLKPFAFLQYSFCNFLLKQGQNKALENYYSFFSCSKDDLNQLTKNEFLRKIEHFYLPQFEIAENMGFDSNWCLN